MKRVTLSLTPVRYYSLMVIAGILVGLYFCRVFGTYYAFIRYTQFLETTFQGTQSNRSQAEEQGDTPRMTDSIPHAIQQAIRHDSNNAEYYAALAEYVSQRSANIPQEDLRKQGFGKAESWLHTALKYDPANPWYYYELGRLSASRNDCADRQPARFPDTLDPCLTARYFLAALSNAPNTVFLRRHVGLWYYRYDRDRAFWIMQDIVARTAGHTLDDRELALGVAQFLYDMRLDYQSDLAYPHPRPFEGSHDVADTCQPLNIAAAPASNKENHVDSQGLEFGNDDGSAEWRTFLTSTEMRVKKVICLPKNIGDYTSAALKILMNNGGNGNFEADVLVNGHLIKGYDQHDPVPRIAAWYEIPFDKNLLQGQSSINVYIRVIGASSKNNFLQIWGDQDTPTTRSVFNFETADDLSDANGKQTGEYMIRLLVRKE